MRKLKIKKWLTLSALMLLAEVVFAASKQAVEMADELRADGKIYVVVAVVLVLVGGLIFYAFRIDKKVTSLEDRLNESDHDQ
ncbi:MAG: CcmD family protein [Cyclobacteriaceae bacterium]